MIEFQLLNTIDLEAFIESAAFRQMPDLPISTHRALSHINNPRAAKEDVLLVIAWENEQMIGYLGLVPDKIAYAGQMEPLAWMSCLWVDPKQRGRRIAWQLLEHAAQAWEKRLIITEFTAPAKRLYDKIGYFRYFKRKGIRLYVRMDLAYILPPKGKRFQQFKQLIKMFDIVSNLFLDIRRLFISRKLKGLQLKYIDQIDAETIDFIEKHQTDSELFKRGDKELNWMVQFPWILNTTAAKEEQKRYYFSAYGTDFQFVPLQLRDESGDLIAFLLFAKRNQNLKLPYCYYTGDIQVVAKVIEHHILKWKISTFTTYHSELAQYFSAHKGVAFHKKEVIREYLLSTYFTEKGLEGRSKIQDGDGDSSFT